MTTQTQTIQSIPVESPAETAPADAIAEEQLYRAGVYSLLGALLRAAPDQALLNHIGSLVAAESEPGELALSMSMLGLAASHCDVVSVDDEYHALFIGLGRGELVPYGSWYQTGFLMEKPLGSLRDDLAALGFERDEGVCEPEDHVAALCEVMAMLIENGNPLEQQTAFFHSHIASWLERFFSDLSSAKTAVFYRAVGRFGSAFTALEKHYLA